MTGRALLWWVTVGDGVWWRGWSERRQERPRTQLRRSRQQPHAYTYIPCPPPGSAVQGSGTLAAPPLRSLRHAAMAWRTLRRTARDTEAAWQSSWEVRKQSARWSPKGSSAASSALGSTSWRLAMELVMEVLLGGHRSGLSRPDRTATWDRARDSQPSPACIQRDGDHVLETRGPRCCCRPPELTACLYSIAERHQLVLAENNRCRRGP